MLTKTYMAARYFQTCDSLIARFIVWKWIQSLVYAFKILVFWEKASNFGKSQNMVHQFFRIVRQNAKRYLMRNQNIIVCQSVYKIIAASFTPILELFWKRFPFLESWKGF